MTVDLQAELGLSDNEVRFLGSSEGSSDSIQRATSLGERMISLVRGLTRDRQAALLAAAQSDSSDLGKVARNVVLHVMNPPIISSPEEDALREEIRDQLTSGEPLEFVPIDHLSAS